MATKLNTKLSKSNRNTIIKLSIYFILCLILYISAGSLLLYIIDASYHAYAFDRYDPMYVMAQIFSVLEPFIIIIYIILGGVMIGYLFFRKPFLYLEELGRAAKQLYDNNSPELSLSPALKDYELDMVNIRLKMLQNEQAAKEAEQRKNDLVVYLAHDLKTPLTSVIGYLSLLKEETQISPELRAKYTSIALDKAERLEDLINEFFDITRFNLTSPALNVSRIDLSLMLKQLAYEFKPMLAEKNLECRLNVPENMYFNCDADKLSRVFDNLLKNAVNYSFENSYIEITMEEHDDKINISFKNNGNTIPQEKLSQIFEQFYRLDNARASNTGGAGLGLAIARQITLLHGGTLEASSYNENIIFRMTLPKNTL